MIGRDCDKRKIYISSKAYTKEAIDEVYKILNGRWK